MQLHDPLPRLQSAYRRHQSTETAGLKALPDILHAIDNGDLSVLALLDYQQLLTQLIIKSCLRV